MYFCFCMVGSNCRTPGHRPLWSEAIAERRATARSTVELGRQAFRIVPWTATAILCCLVSPTNAQVIPTTNEVVAPPWNAQRVFESSPLPDLINPDSREAIPPEDMPVKKRQQPGYEPVGIRAGSWMFNPSLMSGGFYDSNVYSSNTSKRSDIAAVFEPSLRAHTLWERHGIDLKLNTQSTVYQANSSLDQTNVSLKGNAWFDIAHDLAVLTNFQIAHLNEGVGTLSSPSNAVSADALQSTIRRRQRPQGIQPTRDIHRGTGRFLRLRIDARAGRHAHQSG